MKKLRMSKIDREIKKDLIYMANNYYNLNNRSVCITNNRFSINIEITKTGEKKS